MFPLTPLTLQTDRKGVYVLRSPPTLPPTHPPLNGDLLTEVLRDGYLDMLFNPSISNGGLRLQKRDLKFISGAILLRLRLEAEQ